MSNHVVNGLNKKLVESWRTNLPWFYLVSGVALLTVIFSVSGAFDTDELPLIHRLLLWAVVSLLVISQTTALDHWLPGLLPNNWTWGIFAFFAVIVLIVIIMTIELHLLKFTPLLPKKTDPLFEFALFLFPMVASVAAFTILVKNQVAKNLYDDTLEVLDPTLETIVLEEWPKGRVLSVEAQDHYLMVRTSQDSKLIRGRMQDAIARLSGTDGYRVHRSWWIATDEVALVKRHGRDYSVLLKNGNTVPVGRSRTKDLRVEGLI